MYAKFLLRIHNLLVRSIKQDVDSGAFTFKSYFPNKKAPFNFYTQKEEWPSVTFRSSLHQMSEIPFIQIRD